MGHPIGWMSSIILALTIARLVYRRWESGSSERVSFWVFVGQTAIASSLALYSWSISSSVFVVVNALVLLDAFIGYAITLQRRRAEQLARVFVRKPAAEIAMQTVGKIPVGATVVPIAPRRTG